MLVVSFCGLALFVPFSISGANVSIMIGFLAVILSVIAVPAARERIARVRTDPVLFAGLLLVVSAIPSVVMSENIRRALNDWESYWLLLIYFFAAYGLWSWRLRRAVYWILFGSASLSCLVALTQYRGGIEFLFIHIPAKPRPAGTLFIMTFAGILYQLITVNFCVLFHRGRFSRLEGLLGGGILLQVTGIFLTLTRGAWLALAAGLSTACAILRKRGPIVIFATLLALVVAFAAGDSRVRRKIVSIPRSLHGPTDVNVSTRYVLWDVAWQLVKRHPILGVGMGDFTTEAEKLIGERHVETATDSHNIYLQVLATRGLVGFVPFLIFWFVLLRSLWRTRSPAPATSDFGAASFRRHFASGVFAAAVALLVGALTENNIDDSEVFTAFMLLAGMAKSYENYPDPDAGP
jgi:O-antigen ligase